MTYELTIIDPNGRTQWHTFNEEDLPPDPYDPQAAPRLRFYGSFILLRGGGPEAKLVHIPPGAEIRVQVKPGEGNPYRRRIVPLHTTDGQLAGLVLEPVS
jgi:hypothetical protein